MTWAPDYATVAQVKGWIRVPDAVDDTEIQAVVTAASRAIDHACGRQFGQSSSLEARTYEARYYDRRYCRWLVETDDVQDVTGLTMAYGAVAITGASFRPLNATVLGMPYTRMLIPNASVSFSGASERAVTITARWGWSSVPTAVLQAVKIQASRLLSRRDSPYGIAGSPDVGSEMRLLAKLDPDVEMLLSGYVRNRLVAG